MNNEMAMLIIKRVKSNYPNVQMDKDLMNEWAKVLKDYNWEDINNKLTEYMSGESSDRFPKVYTLIKGIPTIKQQQEQKEEYKVECPQCRKFINSKEYEKHFNRCSSVNYIMRQIKKYKMNNMDKGFLWKLSNEEFDDRYKKFLRKIQQLASDENEKRRIEFIFNPPSQEEAKKFINKKENE